MTIKVISQSTAEREDEIHQTFLRLKPLLLNGYTLSKAVQKDRNLKHTNFYNQRWYKDLKKHCIEEGINPLGNY